MTKQQLQLLISKYKAFEMQLNMILSPEHLYQLYQSEDKDVKALAAMELERRGLHVGWQGL